jgi:hypothetical protein
MGAIVTVDTATCYAERTWTGVETSFVAGFKAEQTSDVKVYSRDSAGVETLLTETVHYTVTLGSDGAVTVVPVALPVAPKTILILRDTSALQAIDFANLGAYSPSTHTQLHSRAAMRDAEDKYHRARAYLVPKGETADAIPPIAARKGAVFGWDPTTGAFKLYTPSAAQYYFGSGVPSGGTGNNGDVYLNTANGNIYLKVAGAWVLQGNIAGPAGKSGFAYVWSTSTAATDPTAGKVKINNATASAATALYISETDNDANGLAGEIATWDDSTSTIHGRVKLYNPNVPANFALFDITGANTDNGAWDTLNIAYVTGGGTFANNDNISIVFIPKGDKGDIGNTGGIGPRGVDAGYKYAWSTNTASSDPGAGGIKGNNATIASITSLYISETDGDANAIAAQIATWDDSASTNKARIKIYDPATPTNYAEFFVTGTLTDNGTWDTLPVSYIGSGGTLTNALSVRVLAILIGDKGTTGNTGGTGPRGIDNGFKYTWSTNTASSDPGSGAVKGNNATASSITNIFISETDANANGIAAEIATWDDSTSTNKARVKIYDPATPSNFADFYVSGANTDNGTWDTIVVTYITGGGSFSNGQTVQIEVTLVGDKGAAGAGSGDVLGPATNSADFIPQWNGANSKTLKNGIALGTFGTTLVGEASASSARTDLGLVIGTNVQAYDADLDTLSAWGNWKQAYSNGTGVPTFVALGASGTALVSTGATAAPTMQAVLLAGNNLSDVAAAATARTNLGVAYGKQSIWIPAAAMTARTTNGPSSGTAEMATNKNMVRTLDFDGATQQFAQFDIRMPKSWDEGTVTFIAVVSQTGAATNFGAVFGLDAVARSSTEALDVAFGTAQTVALTLSSGNTLYMSSESSAITIGSTPTEGDVVMFRIHRDPADASDTMTTAARLHGILLLYTNNTTNDS